MDTQIRRLLFTPLVAQKLSAIVPDFYISLPGRKVKAPAQLTSDGSKFIFTLHFSSGTPPAGLGSLNKRYLNQSDQLTVGGQINGEIAFQCRDVFPPAGGTMRSRGTSTIVMESTRMELIAEGFDRGSTLKKRDTFFAHVILHGPKLRIRDSGSKITSKNDFLGEAVASSWDTHSFSGETYEGALIEKDEEIHLHLRSKKECFFSREEAVDLVDRVVRSVAFVFGFHPWPAFREIRINHFVVERWLSPKFGLKHSLLAPISEALWSTFIEERSNPIYSAIPTIADGLAAAPATDKDRIETLLWHVRSSDLSALPRSTKLLILCAAMDGLMKLMAGVASPVNKLATDKTWRRASDSLGLLWEKWTKGIFELWGKYRHTLSHGRLWVPDEGQMGEDIGDYARLGCAFMTVIAVRCGYEGPILADPFERRMKIIRDLKAGS